MAVQVPQIQPEPNGGGLPGARTRDPGRFAALSTFGVRAVAPSLEQTAQTWKGLGDGPEPFALPNALRGSPVRRTRRRRSREL
jgi:hypothetical protein